MFRVIKYARVQRISADVRNLKENRRNAGHSKWANIKHTKAAKDAQKSTTFQKMSRLIRLAIQEGGSSDPNFNSQLSSTIAQARKYNMPFASIQKAIKENKDTKSNAKSCYFEIRGPGGCTIVVYTLTENLSRIRAALNTIVRKHNSSYTEGAIQGLFDHKGVIEAKPPENTTLETAVDHAIEAGAEEFVCTPLVLHQVRGKLEKLQYTIMKADCELIPKIQVTLSDADLEAVRKLCDKLVDDPDVVRLYDNIA
ncbi:probable transcriptional regulatory protein TTE1135 isoform X2 [Cryptotermes secundus]|uniref:probable transcriptional regulatory protein TTE1135 isoform X2 n=1 Tax=Cryptotermes secundus TaxID=105785 RepID=UPI000CD7C928|nr:probable transcriptional regulatory protein TTE1135 isoform X2 [Cryptotermes secundus]